MSEVRPHEMSYGEIAQLLGRYRSVMDALYEAVQGTGNVDAAVTAYRELFPVPVRSSVAESVDFVVDMMNRGELSSESVYPRGRYHGD